MNMKNSYVLSLSWFTCSDWGVLQYDTVVDEADVFGGGGGSGSLPPKQV